MNKVSTVLLAILGGINVTIDMFMPILVAALWIDLNGLNSWTAYLFYGLGLLATLFRAIKVGFLK